MTTALRLRSIPRLLTRSFSTTTATTSAATLRRSSLLNPNLLRSLPAATLPPPATLPSAFRTLCTGDAHPYDQATEEEPYVSLDAQGFPTSENSSGKSEDGKRKQEPPPPPLDGCDFKHWLIVVDPPPPEWTRDEIIDSYIKRLAKYVGSEDEARMKIYSVSTKHYYSFGALISQELSDKIDDEEEGIQWVLPDCYLDIAKEEYGGEPFIDGQAVPYDPKYHEEWLRNNQKARARSSEGPFDDARPRRQTPQGSQNNPGPAGNAQRQSRAPNHQASERPPIVPYEKNDPQS